MGNGTRRIGEVEMSELFPNNIFDPNIVNQPEQEYRKAKYPFHIRHMYIDATTKEEKYWDSSHCPVCFWNEKYGLWDSLIGKHEGSDIVYCRRCGQKVKWDD